MTRLEVRIGKLENIVGRRPLSQEEALSRLCNPDLSELERRRASRDFAAAFTHDECKELLALLDEMLADEAGNAQ